MHGNILSMTIRCLAILLTCSGYTHPRLYMFLAFANELTY
jgi:hypothetical protein